ncbi:hypothetical protein [Marinobacter manganoxydans]|uniref:Uncharacterized protein n=1 Tax=Marinobacter manganoxydans MnI7-9 TaxID=1094979 RepID=G6YV02_9GAMM|nr:hypothetical protein [Marinobacter manganoxydans]EHJ03936.1 hypothetical protein KYE_13485 [Marinobacter manganoxydans MnI7-9]
MRGLMTGLCTDTEGPCKIPVFLMDVVQNALAYAWRLLLKEVAEGQFSICDEEEDTITERLYMILDEISTNHPEAIEGLSLFQTPVREGNLRNRTGNKLDCQPDLTFRPLRGQLVTRSSAMTAILVECKPIDSAHPIGGTYCKTGISRFVREDYAWAVDRALMLGYVRNICYLPNGLTYVLDSTTGQKEYRVKNRVASLGQTIFGDDVYSSVHYRGCDANPKTSKSPIALHHLWLKTEEPCENTRCKISLL